MIIFVTSSKGGAGRTVIGSNVLYQLALSGLNTCYLDMDFGSPTSGAVFGVDHMSGGTTSGRGLHSYLLGAVAEPESVDLWSASDRRSLRNRPAGAGRMVLMPGDAGGGEFGVDTRTVERARQLLVRAEEEFDLTMVDLSAGRSYALQMALTVTGDPASRALTSRWLVFHRWTTQHITSASALVYGEQGILDTGEKLGHNQDQLLDEIRFVRTAVVDPNAPDAAGLRTAQLAWLVERNDQLLRLAAELRLGRTMLLSSIPLDPLLQWHEQLLTDADLYASEVANIVTVNALRDLATRLLDDSAWERQ